MTDHDHDHPAPTSADLHDPIGLLPNPRCEWLLGEPLRLCGEPCAPDWSLCYDHADQDASLRAVR